MIPLRDENPTRTRPFVNHALVAINVAVFIYHLMLGVEGGDDAYMGFVQQMGLTPGLLTSPSTWSQTVIPAPLTLLTSMFVHGGILHLAGNMLYLWVFGDNIEDTLGHISYLLFYLACGFGAAIAQVLIEPGSVVPMVGASGAIAGVLGAYLVLHPHAQVLTLVFLVIFIRIMYLPASILLGIWFAMQIFSAFAGGGGGVAWYAHIGGFLVGVLLVSVFTGGAGRGGRKRKRKRRVHPNPNLHVVH